MKSYKIAGLYVDLEFFGKIMKNQALEYTVEGNEDFDISIRSVKDETIKIIGEVVEEREKSLITQSHVYRYLYSKEEGMIKKSKGEHLNKTDSVYTYVAPLKRQPHLLLEDWEYIETGFGFSWGLLEFNGFCLHASAVALNNKAVLFSGPCGTGKSTHTRLWQEVFGEDKAVIINDDKPAIRLLEDRFYVYGTPWSGKTDINKNIKVPLEGIVFLEQGPENTIQRLSNRESIQWLFFQSLRPNGDPEKTEKLLKILEKVIEKIPIYKMKCTPTKESVMLSYETTMRD